MPVAWLSTIAGLQVPVILLVETAGNTGGGEFTQTDCMAPNANVGGMIGFTVTVILTGGAQGSDVGVKVYEPLVVLLTTAGFHTPVMPLVEVVGNSGEIAPAQIDRVGPILKTGVMIGFTVNENTVGTAHCPASGVNV